MKKTLVQRMILLAGTTFTIVFPAFTTTPTLSDVSFEKGGGNYYCYPYLNSMPPAQTLPPIGYEPFHLEHYGRHGSRWLIGDEQYNAAFNILDKAEKAGKLTPLGKKTLKVVKQIREASYKKDGELSDHGAWQHQGIGERMAKNYPQIFNHNTNIDARSTVVIRSILSMFNGLNGIQRIVPNINIRTDASYADMWYMNYDDKEAWQIKHHADTTVLRDFNKHHANKGEYLGRLINDPKYAEDSIGNKLFNSLFSVLINTQSHSDQPWLVQEIFSPEEMRDRWLCRSANWFLQGGNSKLTDNRMPFSQANLLMNIIESADTTLTSTVPSVNLRYGHDTIVMPLTVLLELDNFGDEINNLEELAEKGWHDYLIVPMAANIQLVFYRKHGSISSDEVLVKVLLNEKEATLPLESVSGPYYKWTDFKKYYINKIKPYISENR
ncbi:MAG: histidine phosphatase family protein [Bacteroides sp.]|nr:histidine phosphatase family protein [Bacteroides sp.]